MRRPLAAGYAFIITANMNLVAFFTLAPTFRDDLGLTKFETSLLFTGAGVMMLVTALPLGFFSDRIGRHRVAVAAAALIVVTAIGHAAATDFWSLLAFRLLFGLAFTGMLTAGIAWTVLSVAPKSRARAIGGVMPVAASSVLIGPYLAGALTDIGGTRLAYGVLAALSGLSLIWLAFSPVGDRERHEQPAPRELLRVMRSTVVLAAFVLLFLGVLVDVMVNVLVPLQLDENGLSASAIGAILSAGGVLYLLSSLIAARNADRIVNLRWAGVAGLLIAVTLVPLAASSATGMQAAGTIARGLALGLCFTVAFPLGALGATAMGVGLGAANGALMVASGFANAAGPIGGERVANAIGGTWAFAGLALACAVSGLWMLHAARAPSASMSLATSPGSR